MLLCVQEGSCHNHPPNLLKDSPSVKASSKPVQCFGKMIICSTSFIEILLIQFIRLLKCFLNVWSIGELCICIFIMTNFKIAAYMYY